MIEVEVKVDTSKFDRAMADFPVRIAQAQCTALRKELQQRISCLL